MSEQENTPHSNQVDILAELWIKYKDDPEFADFVQYNDLGLPLAYSLSHGIIDGNDQVNGFITETWNILLTAVNVEDTGFETLDDLLGSV